LTWSIQEPLICWASYVYFYTTISSIASFFSYSIPVFNFVLLLT